MKKKVMASLLLIGMMAVLTACGSANESSAKADENGNYLVNGSFEDAELTGWTLNNVDDVTEKLGALNVKDGEITVGISVTNAPGGWGTIDGITLVKE